MDFAFSEEQEMLRSQARSYLHDRFPEERVVELAGSEEGWDPASWREMAELGWLGLSAPEASGGAGMGFLEETVLFEELGWALFPGPYFSSVALALPALQNDPGEVERLVSGASTFTLAWAEPQGLVGLQDVTEAEGAGIGTVTKASPGGQGWTLDGQKVLVPDLASAERIVVLARGDQGPGLWVVERTAAVTRSHSTMDPTRRYGTLDLSGTPASLLVEPARTKEVMRQVRLRALAALSLEAVGVAQRALDISRAYVGERKQFGKPIGSYQAVSHQVADSYMGTELARSTAYRAAWCVAEDDAEAPVAAADAKARAGENAVAVCERAIQVLGGIGFTWEHILHRLYKRAQWIDSFEGFGATQRSVVASALLG